MPLPAGTRLGPYEIVALLGAGGMGEVYRARDTRLDRAVAIKTLHEQSGSPEGRSRFEREARAIAALSHAHICTVHDVGHHAGIDFLVMELLDGETLAARLAKGPLPIDQVLTYAIEIASALDKAHRQGIVHRDLKPANIMLVRSASAAGGSPQTKLLDFGLATLRPESAPTLNDQTRARSITSQGQILGTLAYMAPEQLEGRRADARSDIFAFGAIVFEMITGKRAFDSPSLMSLAPGTPPALERLVTVCLAKDPDERWSSAHDVLLQLKGICRDPPVRGRLRRAAARAASASSLRRRRSGAAAGDRAGHSDAERPRVSRPGGWPARRPLRAAAGRDDARSWRGAADFTRWPSAGVRGERCLRPQCSLREEPRFARRARYRTRKTPHCRSGRRMGPGWVSSRPGSSGPSRWPAVPRTRSPVRRCREAAPGAAAT